MKKKYKIYIATRFDKFSNHLLQAIESVAPPHAEIVRHDFIAGAQNIAQAIQDQIASCDLIIVDITDANPNVMYEFGFARAMDKQVIPITASDIRDLPADIRQYYVLQYDKSDVGLNNLKDKLAVALKQNLTSSSYKLQKTANLFSDWNELNIQDKLASAIHCVIF